MRTSSGLALAALALAMTGAAAAQRIEISSPSIGTVVVTPPVINDNATRTGARASARGRTGVDLGVKRRADGSLYDPLDPNQNPAAATASTTANGPNAGAAPSAAAPAANANMNAAGGALPGTAGAANGGVPFGNAPAPGTGSGFSSYNPAATGASNVDSNPGAANALNGSGSGFTNPGTASGAASGGAGARGR
ncbi:MAG TPA: hypothetical protein VFC24_13860 [Casimicrobiaceae bacterium]|nr:hypothetical protein [Casimicrobiaceae bacterium]